MAIRKHTKLIDIKKIKNLPALIGVILIILSNVHGFSVVPFVINFFWQSDHFSDD